MLLFNYCLLLVLLLFIGFFLGGGGGRVCFCVWSLFCYAVLSVPYSFPIILMMKIELVALLLLSSWCHVTVSVMWLFLNVPWVDLQCVIVVFSDLTHFLTRLLFSSYSMK